MNKIIKGRRPMLAVEAEKIREYFGAPPTQQLLEPNIESRHPSVKTFLASSADTPSDDALPPLLRWHTAIAGGATGGWVLNANRVSDKNPRSADYAYAENAFQVEVVDSKNSHVYELRDILTIDPDIQVQAGDDVLCTGDPHQPNGAPALLGHLVKATQAEWVIFQHAAPKHEIRLARSEWPNAWRVINRKLRR